MTSAEGGGGVPHLADARDIEQWSERVEARTDFPSLIRRLIRQTNDQVVTLEMRAAEGAGFAGFDGQVEASKATPLVPQGYSVWELGVGESPKGKADEDYDKRTENSLGIDKSQTTFVFATARRWAGKNAWVIEKRKEGKWRDVKAFDADDLEIAFESAPAARFWFGELIGKPVAGVRSIEDWWDSFSRFTQPNLTSQMVLAGRANEASALLRILEEETRITTISAASVDDVLAFVAATLLSTAEPMRGDLLARTLIVYDGVSLRRLDSTANLLVLLPFEDELRRQAQLVGSHHVILLAPENVPCDIQLPRIDRNEFAETLVELGVEKDTVEKFARTAQLSIVAFQREAPSRGAPPRSWSPAFSSKIVRRAWLAGSWHEARSGDIDALGSLFGIPYEDARTELDHYASGEDPLFTTVGATWALTSSEEAWRFGAAQVNLMDLAAVEAVIQTVLGAVDPALELEVDERWKASIYGKTRIHSADLRKGLATTLAIFGGFGADKQVASSGTAAEWAASVVASLLSRANEDASGQLWASLSDVLPLLAEAAPDVFLQAVQEGATERSEPLLTTMFIDQGDAFSVSSPHTGLLWALESVAWSPEHGPLAIKLLARLAEIDPGGRLSNRPLESLKDIFRPWFPQTSLPPSRRLSVLDSLRRDHDAIAWKLMLELLPEHHGVGNYTHSPRFRSWKSEGDPLVYRSEFWEFSSAVAQRLLEDVDRVPDRWLDLVEHFARIPSSDRPATVARLRELSSSSDLSEELRNRLWTQLDKTLRQHRSFPDAEWSLPSDELDDIAELVVAFAPSDPVEAHTWLFDDYLPDIGVRADYSAQQARVDAARSDAVADVLEREGTDGLVRIAKRANFPRFVGNAIASHASSDIDEFVVSLLDSEESKLADMASGYSFLRARDLGLDWIRARLEGIDGRPLAQARLLQVSDELPEVWSILAELGKDVENAYWKEFATGGRGHDFEYINESAQALLTFSRPIAALDLLSLYVRQEDRLVSEELVLKALEELVGLGVDHEEQIQRLSSYELESLLDYLRQSDVPEERLGLLEWQLLPARGFDARSPVLERRLARDPAFFVDILSLVYRPRGDGGDETEEVPEHIASNAYRLFSDWKIVPGAEEQGGEVNQEQLFSWVNKARQLLAERNRAEVGDVQIGKVLSHDRGDEDGSWPSRPVRNLIEQIASPQLEEGFEMQVYTNRGVTTRGLTDGGEQERELAQKFSKRAERIRDEWPRTAAVLASLGRGYERQARREDEEAERVQQGMERR